ncbi:efflux RND transporter periplasmic adaptor subunit, partial [Bacteroides caecimuris]
MKKCNRMWLMLCLAFVLTPSCSDKKNSADEQEKGVTT